MLHFCFPTRAKSENRIISFGSRYRAGTFWNSQKRLIAIAKVPEICFFWLAQATMRRGGTLLATIDAISNIDMLIKVLHIHICSFTHLEGSTESTPISFDYLCFPFGKALCRVLAMATTKFLFSSLKRKDVR